MEPKARHRLNAPDAPPAHDATAGHLVNGALASEPVRIRRRVRPTQGDLRPMRRVAPLSEEQWAAPADGHKAWRISEPAPAWPSARRTGSDDVEADGAIYRDANARGAAPMPPEDMAPDPASFEDDEFAASDAESAILGSDGRMDFGAAIRNRAKSVRASELAARHDRVHVLDMGTIKQLMQEAVEEASRHFQRELDDGDRKRLLEEAEGGFKERLKAFQAEKLSSEARLSGLADQLILAEKTLQEERSRTIKAEQFTVSESGLDAIEQKFKRLLERSIAEGRVVPSLEEELRKVIATVFDQERARIRELEMKAQNERILLLENKVKRLSIALEDTERQRDAMQEWARLMEAQGGGSLRNVFSAGLKVGDPNKKRKLALMKEILDINRAIRKDLGIDIKPIDEETLEAIRKTEAEATLTDVEKEEIRLRRLSPEADPMAEPDAELANVIAEGGDGAGSMGAAGAADGEAGDQPWADERRTVAAADVVVRITADGAQTLAEGAQIDPDDLQWQPSSASDGEGAATSSMKQSRDPRQAAHGVRAKDAACGPTPKASIRDACPDQADYPAPHSSSRPIPPTVTTPQPPTVR